MGKWVISGFLGICDLCHAEIARLKAEVFLALSLPKNCLAI